MDQTAIQILTALVSVTMAVVAVFVAIKVALAESRKDIAHMSEQIKETKEAFAKHVDNSIHPSRDQITALAKEIGAVQDTLSEAHQRIEGKVDNIMNLLMDSPLKRPGRNG